MPPQRQVGIDALLERRQPLLLQRSLGSGEGVTKLRQRRASPQGQPFPEQPGGLHGLLPARGRDQLLEAMEVELAVADADEVARGSGEDQIPAEGLA